MIYFWKETKLLVTLSDDVRLPQLSLWHSVNHDPVMSSCLLRPQYRSRKKIIREKHGDTDLFTVNEGDKWCRDEGEKNVDIKRLADDICVCALNCHLIITTLTLHSPYFAFVHQSWCEQEVGEGGIWNHPVISWINS